ncbi:hypothetical protein Syun_023561 [Stephania yunnanensis]|uniref:Uncharacterized protein n=1 Tax=Stephania yunnanensis TaxID=152371 RepID=A0AAP0I3I7_9MAGN
MKRPEDQLSYISNNYKKNETKKKCTGGKLSSDRRGTCEGSATDDGGRDSGGREAGTAAGRAAGKQGRRQGDRDADRDGGGRDRQSTRPVRDGGGGGCT